jgi:hypothetical protein
MTLTLQALGGLVCLWLLRGVFKTILALASRVRQLDEECCRLKEQLSALYTLQRQRVECPHCASNDDLSAWARQQEQDDPRRV